MLLYSLRPRALVQRFPSCQGWSSPIPDRHRNRRSRKRRRSDGATPEVAVLAREGPPHWKHRTQLDSHRRRSWLQWVLSYFILKWMRNKKGHVCLHYIRKDMSVFIAFQHSDKCVLKCATTAVPLVTWLKTNKQNGRKHLKFFFSKNVL